MLRPESGPPAAQAIALSRCDLPRATVEWMETGLKLTAPLSTAPAACLATPSAISLEGPGTQLAKVILGSSALPESASPRGAAISRCVRIAGAGWPADATGASMAG